MRSLSSSEMQLISGGNPTQPPQPGTEVIIYKPNPWVTIADLAYITLVILDIFSDLNNDYDVIITDEYYYY